MALAFLKELLGAAYTEQLDAQISEAVGKGFVARADFNALKESKKALEAQLSEANAAIEGFRAADKDLEAERAKAAEYKARAEQAETEYKARAEQAETEYRARAGQAEQDAARQLEDYKFNSWFDALVSQRGGRNAAVIRTLAGEEQLAALRRSKNRDEDGRALFDALEKEAAYAFEDKTPPPPPSAAGAAQTVLADDTAAYRAAAGLAGARE